ncbi:MAG: hypothetical protein SGARI_005380 [Bacillariaceae sp.]
MSVVDTATVNEIVPNGIPVELNNDCFHGHVMLMIRTPDVDNAKETPPTLDSAARISQYFKNYKRRFEFQFQIKLKKVPTGPLFLGCEVDEMIQMSRFTKGLSGVLLTMIGRINSGFHYSWGIEKDSADEQILRDGAYEKTHLSFPVEASMDRIVITKPGETPPELGHALHETNASVKRRRRMGAGSVDWNLEDTVVGVRSFSLSAVTGQQPIYLSVYEVKDISNEEYKKKKPPHRRCDLNVYTRLEFSHNSMTNVSLNPRLQKMETEDDGSFGDTDSDVDTRSKDDTSND